MLLANLITPALYELFLSRSLPSRGFALALPAYPIQSASALCVAYVNFVFRGSRKYSSYVWVVPVFAVMLASFSTSPKAFGLNIWAVLTPPITIEEMDYAVPLYTSSVYSLSITAFYYLNRKGWLFAPHFHH
jgi:hypothetical protein